MLIEERSNLVGFGRSTVFAYRQYARAPDNSLLEVMNAQARIVVLHGIGGAPHRVAYVAAKLVPVVAGSFAPDTRSAGQALASVQGSDEFGHLSEWSTPVLVIYQDPLRAPVRAWEFTGSRSDPLEAYRFFVDAADGALIASWNEVYEAGLRGRVRAMATPGELPDGATNPPIETPLEDAAVRSLDAPLAGGNEAFSGPIGNYALSYGGAGGLILRADFVGQWARVTNVQSGLVDLSEIRAVDPSTPLDFVFNLQDGEGREYATAQVNALKHVIGTRGFYRSHQPDFAALDTPLICEVNDGNSCNASFAPTPFNRVRFRVAGPQPASGLPCPNSAYSSIIAHEFGHFIHHQLGVRIGQSAFNEGFADSVAALSRDNPIMGSWFFGPGTCTRDNGAPPNLYPCADLGSVHSCGQVLAGCWWDVREQLGGAGGIEFARQLFTDWSQFTLGGGGVRKIVCGGIPLRGDVYENAAHPLTAIEALIADDLAYGDGDFTNGTPHDCKICLGFAQHGIPCPPIVLANECMANGVPDRCERDCNLNETADSCDIVDGTSQDCDVNGVPDECEDCNENGTGDGCDIAAGTSLDCSDNGIPDECELAGGDCNNNGVADSCDIVAGTSQDCPSSCVENPAFGIACLRTSNGIPDECEPDCDGDGTVDTCALAFLAAMDCNANAVPDSCDLTAGTSDDCNENAVPDECETDCDQNGFPDDCDIAADPGLDCDRDGVPDDCQPEADCNANSLPDRCETALGTAPDCNANSVPDECELAEYPTLDCPAGPNGVLDVCEPDCNVNGTADSCDIATGFSPDCDGNGTPDECDLVSCRAHDCNGNGVLDFCDIASGTSADGNEDGIPDECLIPPLIVSVASVGYHEAFGGWPGGEVELCVDPELGAIEPRVQTPTAENGQTQLFLRVTFDQPMDAASLTVAGVVPGPGLDADLSQPTPGSDTIEIRFTNPTNGGAAAVPAGSYTVDVAGVESLASGVRAGGACASFRICYATGDVNCDGRATFADVGEIRLPSNLNRDLSETNPDVNKKADLARDGLIDLSDVAIV